MKKRLILICVAILIVFGVNYEVKAHATDTKTEEVKKEAPKKEVVTKKVEKKVVAKKATPKKTTTKKVVKESKSKVEEKVEKSIAKHESKHLTKNQYEARDVKDLTEILPMTDANNVPRIVYGVDKISLKDLSVQTKKEKFFAVMVPTALVVREEIEKEREGIKMMIDGKKDVDQAYLDKMYKKYRIKDKKMTSLYKAMKPVPVSVLLSQAILESGWGTSRVFHQANNIFGVWSVDPNESRIKAAQARKDKQVYLKKYDTLKGSIEDYMSLIGRHSAYKGFRDELQKSEKSADLIPYLDKYSEIGKEYTARLRSTIKHNNLDKYDSYKLEQ